MTTKNMFLFNGANVTAASVLERVSDATPVSLSADVILDNANLTKKYKCTHPASRTIFKPF